MGATPRAIIITVPKIGGVVHPELLSRSKSPNFTSNLDMNPVQDLENRLLLPTDLHSTMTDRRKKRLNNLSYEEKMHRKKLKNRVAAQTSRDRKKAKMDELERTNQKLQEQNARLTAECEMLRAQNARLQETTEAQQKELADRLSTTTSCLSCLAKQASPSTTTPHTPGPAESGSFPLLKGWGSWMSRSLVAKHMTSLGNEDMSVDEFNLPSLPDLLEDLENLDNFSCLEKLAESLLEDAQSFAVVESSESSRPAEMVGQAPENVEPHGAVTSGRTGSTVKSPEAVLSERVTGSAQFQELFDSIASSVSSKEDTLDCVAVVIPSEDVNGNTIFLEEAVEEVVTTEIPMEEEDFHPSSPLSEAGNLKTDPYSDYGYESLDSPHSDISSDTSMTCMWTENFSTLFPNLV